MFVYLHTQYAGGPQFLNVDVGDASLKYDREIDMWIFTFLVMSPKMFYFVVCLYRL